MVRDGAVAAGALVGILALVVLCVSIAMNSRVVLLCGLGGIGGAAAATAALVVCAGAQAQRAREASRSRGNASAGAGGEEAPRIPPTLPSAAVSLDHATDCVALGRAEDGGVVLVVLAA